MPHAELDLSLLKPDALQAWRKRFRTALRTPVIPDFHEALCQLAKAYEIQEQGDSLGYFLLAQETFQPGWGPVIPEFFLEDMPVRRSRAILRSLFGKIRPHTIITRTDDPRAFPWLLDLHYANELHSPLYLLDAPLPWAETRGWAIGESRWQDAMELWPFYTSLTVEFGGLPDPGALTKSLALWRHYHLRVHGQVAAVAYIVPQGPQFFTAATIVAENQRGRGYGKYLTSYAVSREVAEGKRLAAVLPPGQDAAKNLLESLGVRLAAEIFYFHPIF